MRYGATKYKQATITGGAGAGTNYPMMVEAWAHGLPIETVSVSARSSTNVNAFQGVCTDGTYYYTSSSTNLYKYTVSGTTWTLVASRSVTGDNPTSKTQINGLTIRASNGLLYAGASDFASGTSTAGWVVEYNPATLLPTGNYWSVGAYTEGGAWRGNEFFAVYHDAGTIKRYDSNFNLQKTYTVTTGGVRSAGGWYQSGTWMGDIFIVPQHGQSVYGNDPRLEGFKYRPAADDFVRVFSIPKSGLTTNFGQGVFYDAATNRLLLAERDYVASTDNRVAICTFTVRPNCVDLAGLGGRADFGDVVVSDASGNALAGASNGWRERKVDEVYSRIWFKHTADLGSNQNVRVYYGSSSRTWTDAGTGFNSRYEGFESNTVGVFSASYLSGAGSVDSATPLDGTYSLTKTTDGTDGIHSANDTFVDAARKRVVFYVRPKASGTATEIYINRLVSGNTVRRAGLSLSDFAIQRFSSGSFSSVLTGNYSAMWLRVELAYDYAGTSCRIKVWRDDDGSLLVTSTATTDDVVRDYRDILFFRAAAKLDHVFSLAWNGAANEPSLGSFGSAQAVPAIPKAIHYFHMSQH